MVKERRPDGSVRTYVDKDMKQSIILNLLEKIPDFPLEKRRGQQKRKMRIIENNSRGVRFRRKFEIILKL